jgi:hypothetical protein
MCSENYYSMLRLFALLLLSAALLGCSVRRAQVNVQTGLTTLAEGLRATDSIVADRAESFADESMEYAEEQVASNPEANGFDIYRERMEPWYSLVRGLEVTRSALLLGQAAFDIWVSSGELPESWGDFCRDISNALSSLVSLLENTGVDTPERLTRATPSAELVCTLAVAYFSRE